MPLFDSCKSVSFPNAGLVRFPAVSISDDVKAKFGLAPDCSSKELLRKAAWAGYLDRKKKGDFNGIEEKVVIDRFKNEFEVFEKTGTYDYILMVWEVNLWADSKGIVHGPGRGSAASSLTLYCLRVTDVNPIKYGLYFSRFLSEARLKPKIINGVIYVDGKMAPDIDEDYEFGRRDEVVKHLEELYEGRTCKISTRLQLTGKTALKDVLKVYAGFDEEGAKMVSGVLENKFGVGESLTEAEENNIQMRAWIHKSPANRKVFDMAKALEGLNVARGQHPSGVFINFDVLDGNVPVELSKTKDVVTSVDMEIAATQSIKLDILGVRTIDLIANTCRMVGMEVKDINPEDLAIYQYLSLSDNYQGLFQIEAGITKDVAHKAGPRNLSELAACISISRPGALKYIDKFVRYIKTGEIEPTYKEIDAILERTGGVLLYQEQITQICHEVFGLTLVEADMIRLAVGKKLKAEMAKWEPVLRENAKQRGLDEKLVDYFWNTCNASADYLFVCCLSPDTTVETPDGTKMMSGVKVGDKVKAYDTKRNQDHFVEVGAVYPSKVDVYKVTFDNGRTIEASLNHKFLCQSGEMVALAEIITNGFSVVTKSQSQDYNVCVGILFAKFIGQRDTLDFKVNHPDHNFYANNIVVSNSHAFSYATIAAQTTYMKAKYPKEFYVTMLKLAKEEPDSTLVITDIIHEMSKAGLKVLPPDLLLSSQDFTIENDGIRFGLSSIKSVSEIAMVKIASLNKNFSNKFEIFESAAAAKIPINILTNLIYTGCLKPNFPVSRAKLVLEAQTYNELSDREKILVHRFAAEYKEDLLAILRDMRTKLKNDKGVLLMKESRYNTLKRDFAPYWEMYQNNIQCEEFTYYLFEKHHLGFSFTSSLHAIYSKKIVGLTTVASLANAPMYEDSELDTPDVGERRKKPYKKNHKFVGMVVECEILTSRKSKERYARMNVADDTGNVTVLIIGKEKTNLCVDINKRFPEEEDVILVEGSLSDDRTVLFANHIIIQPNPVKLKKPSVKNEPAASV